MKNELFDIVEPMMKAQQDMYRAGYQEGYRKGKIDGIKEAFKDAKEIVDDTLKEV